MAMVAIEPLKLLVAHGAMMDALGISSFLTVVLICGDPCCCGEQIAHRSSEKGLDGSLKRPSLVRPFPLSAN
jgi:hypothetical protein